MMAYDQLGCRDFARIDFRVRDGVPYFIEANPLPGLAPVTSDLVILAAGYGIGHAELIRRILHAALVAGGLWRERRAPERGRPVQRPESAAGPPRPRVGGRRRRRGRGDRGEPGERGVQGLGGRRRPTARRVGPPTRRAATRRRLQPDRRVRRASGGEAHVTGLLELLGLAYTGCPPEAQGLGHSKGRTKALLRGSGLPTASFVVARPTGRSPTWDGPWPAIVKPDARGREPRDRPGERRRVDRGPGRGGRPPSGDSSGRRPDRGVPPRSRVQRRPPRLARPRSASGGRDRLRPPPRTAGRS